MRSLANLLALLLLCHLQTQEREETCEDAVLRSSKTWQLALIKWLLLDRLFYHAHCTNHVSYSCLLSTWRTAFFIFHSAPLPKRTNIRTTLNNTRQNSRPDPRLLLGLEILLDLGILTANRLQIRWEKWCSAVEHWSLVGGKDPLDVIMHRLEANANIANSCFFSGGSQFELVSLFSWDPGHPCPGWFTPIPAAL